MTDPSAEPLTTFARFLRQQQELGNPAWVLSEGFLPGPWLEHLRAEGVGGRGSPSPVPVPALDLPSPSPRPQSPPSPPPPLPTFSGDLESLRVECSACTRCGLAGSRSQVVFSDGPPDAPVLVVGEAPGAQEDQAGLPFVGAAGQLLDLLLASVGLDRKTSVYICNVIKCRPPGNRNPLPEEIEACAPFLRAQIRAVQPRAILAVGTFAGQLLSGESLPLGRLRGSLRQSDGIPLVVTYHPAALLRNPGWTRPTWEDLQQLRRVLDGR